MSYESTEWKNGDIITSEKLNNIETGVRSMNSEYVPTEWKNGDIITAEKLNNIEQGIIAGGGGSLEDVYKPILTLTIRNPELLTISLETSKIVSNSIVYGYLEEASDSEIVLVLPIIAGLVDDNAVFEAWLAEIILDYGTDLEGSVSNLVNATVEDTILTITNPTQNASATVTVTLA